MANNGKTCCVVGPVDMHKTQRLKSADWEECIVTNTDRNPICPRFLGIKRHCPSFPQNLVQSDKVSGFFERYVIVYAHFDKLSRLKLLLII